MIEAKFLESPLIHYVVHKKGRPLGRPSLVVLLLLPSVKNRGGAQGPGNRNHLPPTGNIIKPFIGGNQFGKIDISEHQVVLGPHI